MFDICSWPPASSHGEKGPGQSFRHRCQGSQVPGLPLGTLNHTEPEHMPCPNPDEGGGEVVGPRFSECQLYRYQCNIRAH